MSNMNIFWMKLSAKDCASPRNANFPIANTEEFGKPLRQP